MKKIREIDGLGLTVILFLVAWVMIFLLGLTLRSAKLDAQEQARPNPIVIAFLDEYVPLRVTHEQQQVIEKYFSTTSARVLDEIGRSEDLRNFNTVFCPNGEVNSSYRICISAQNYVELMLVDAKGNDMPCRIGFCYRIGANKISSYNIARLQPLDRTDPEWNGVWV